MSDIAKRFEEAKRNFTKAQDFIDFVERNSPLDSLTEERIEAELKRKKFVLSDIDFTPRNVAYFFSFSVTGNLRGFFTPVKFHFEGTNLFLLVGLSVSVEIRRIQVGRFYSTYFNCKKKDFHEVVFEAPLTTENTEQESSPISASFFIWVNDWFQQRRFSLLNVKNLKEIASNKQEISIPPTQLQEDTLLFNERGYALRKITKG